MPCFDLQAAQERDTAVREALTLRKVEAVLCAVTNYLGSKVVMKAMDSQNPGVSKAVMTTRLADKFKGKVQC